MYRPIIYLTASILIAACSANNSPKENDGLSSFSVNSLEERIKTLSSDEFMGRKPFTEGEAKTIAYLQKEYEKTGLEPGNGNSFLQEVPLVEITTTADPLMTVDGSKGKFQLNGFNDYVIWTQSPEGASFNKDELVFAGYGIVAPEYNWNDYKGLDVKGKVVIVFVNDPGFGLGDTTFFKGNNMTYYGRWTYKFEEAARQGAKGCLVVHDDVPASYGFWVVQNSWNASKLYLDTRSSPVCAVEGWISLPTTKKLFESAGLNYPEKLAAAHKEDFQGESLRLRITTNLKAEAKYNTSYNVIGKITGSTRPDEYILYSAHWDHLGIGKPENGDSIYNGALDNASGTAGMLEIAKAFKSQTKKPERTILFLAVTAEEQGLLGSAYYAQAPIYPTHRTVANINMDGINPYGKMKDISLVGIGQSEMEDYLEEVARQHDRYATPDPMPSAGYYFRSDHFNFAKVGIPALYTHTGIDHAERGQEYGKQLSEEYVSKYYHKPSDEYDTTRWNLDGAIDDLKLLFLVGKRLAFETVWPQWKEGSEFKAIREKDLK